MATTKRKRKIQKIFGLKTTISKLVRVNKFQNHRRVQQCNYWLITILKIVSNRVNFSQWIERFENNQIIKGLKDKIKSHLTPYCIN